MERVHFQQEQMLAELKDFVQKGLFTQQEVKQIMKRRTAYETALVRRVAKKNDYLRYAAYEMGLEALRKKRVERLKLPRSAPSISDYALVRRQFHIFERALKKFKSDVALWVQYIQVAKREGARSLMGRICARALQLHPNVPQLYILAASHELSHLSPSAARALLQRGIRLNSESVEMWREYIKMEIGFVEGMRRRWGVLGIEVKGKGKARDTAEDGMDANEVEKIQADAEGTGDEAEQARKEIMQGAIAKSVISHAVKALPKAELFTSLHTLIITYPAPDTFKMGLLDHLHELLRITLPTDPVAVRLTASRALTPGLSGAALVDALKEVNENLSNAVQRAISENTKDADGLGSAYADFVQEWVQKSALDDALKVYLLTSLHALIQGLCRKGLTLPALLTAHLTLLASQHTLTPQLPYTKVLADLPKRYTAASEARTNAQLWIARLEFEKSSSQPSSTQVDRTWKEARDTVRGSGALEAWTWGIPSEEVIEDEERAKTVIKLLEELSSESMRIQDAPSFRSVHDELLLRSALLSKYLVTPNARLVHFRRIVNSYLPDAQTFKAFFLSESSLLPKDTSEEVLRDIYQIWRRRDAVEASLAWAGWLVGKGRGREAGEVIQSARAEVSADESERMRLENRWRDVLQEMEKGDANEDEDGDQEMADA